MISVKQLFIYPLKSAKGISLEKLDITETGPLFDREWMLVNKNGRFLSQRTHPQLGQFATQINDQHLVISYANEQIEIPLIRQSAQQQEVQIFGKSATGEKQGLEFDQWFSQHLNEEVTLVRSLQQPNRTTSGNHGPITPIHFADGYPLLMTNEATLDDLNQRLEQPISMNRFRPNIVIQGCPSDTEDTFNEIEIGNLSFLAVKACTRCQIIDLDQESATRKGDIHKALKTYRTNGKQVIFGQNLTHIKTGTVQVGDSIQVLSNKDSALNPL